MYDKCKVLKDFSFAYSGAFKTGDITWNTTTGAITSGSGGLFNKGGLDLHGEATSS